VVTQAMTSLTGSAGEDFASILRAPRLSHGPPPPLAEKPVETVAAETPRWKPRPKRLKRFKRFPAIRRRPLALLPDMGVAANDKRAARAGGCR